MNQEYVLTCSQDCWRNPGIVQSLSLAVAGHVEPGLISRLEADAMAEWLMTNALAREFCSRHCGTK
jgi:hypothetical protein